MIKQHLAFIGLLFSVQLMSQTGIGTTIPVNKFQVETSTADPLTSGNNVKNGHLRISGTSATHLLDVGLMSTSSNFGTWFQARKKDDYSVNYNLLLNPNGGNVGIGTNSPVDRLDIRSAMSVNEIKFRGTDGGDDSDPYRLRKLKIGNSNELQLHLNDDSDERLAIYGNSCLTQGCPEYSTHLYHYFRSDGNVYQAGRVGIGTTTPAVPLHVASSELQHVSTYGYLSQTNASGSYYANTNVYYSIQADQRIRAPEFNAISDARIKNNILKLNTSITLTDLNKLQVVNYSYIDQIANGNNIKTGLIAQEVEKVNHQFVNQSTDFIPSIYALAKSTSLVNDLLKITTDKPHEF